MKLTSNIGSFFKFNAHGDKIEGKFVAYDENVPGKFGPENLLILDTAAGHVRVKCPASLARTLHDNRDRLPGRRLRIEYVSDRPTTKGKPMKMFDVESNEEPNAYPARRDEDREPATDDIPF